MMVAPSHRLRAFHVTMISIGGIIGAGLFVGTSATIAAAGPAVLLSYLGAALFVWLVMRLLAALAIEAQGRGSFITHIHCWLGSRAAFVTGWSYAFLWAVTAGAQAVAGGFILHQLSGVSSLMGALAFVAMAWAINRLSLRHYGQAEAGLSVLKLVFIVGFILLSVLWLCFSVHPFLMVREHLLADGGFFPKGFWAVLGAIPMIMQTFTGCEIAVVASIESDRPVENVRKTVQRLPLQVLFFYVGSVAVIVTLVPWSHIHVGYSPFLSVLERVNVPFASWVAVSVTLIAILSCLNSSVYVVSRVMKELAYLSLAPMSLAKETARHVPLWALRLTTLLELGVIAAAIGSPARMYPVLLGASGGIILFVYFMIVCASRKIGQSALGKGNYLVALGMSVMIPFLGVFILCFSRARYDIFLSCLVITSLSVFSVVLGRKSSSFSE